MEAPRQRGQHDLLRVHLALRTERSTNVWRQNAHLIALQTKDAGDAVADAIDPLRRGPHGQPAAVRVDGRRRCSRLHIAANHAPETKCVADDDRLIGERARGISETALDVARDIRSEIVVEDRRPVSGGGLHVADAFQRLVIDLDARCCVHRAGGIVGHHYGDRLADIAHLARRQYRSRTTLDTGWDGIPSSSRA